MKDDSIMTKEDHKEALVHNPKPVVHACGATIGDIVKYAPSQDYGLTTSSGGDLLFEIYHKSPNTRGQSEPKRYHGPTNPKAPNEKWHPRQFLEIGKHLQCWNAKITAIYSDGTADLEIYHPNGCQKLFHSKVKYDTQESANSWHK